MIIRVKRIATLGPARNVLHYALTSVHVVTLCKNDAVQKCCQNVTVSSLGLAQWVTSHPDHKDICQEEEACIKQEKVLNKELEEKHLRLAEVKSKLEEAKQSNTHRKELRDIKHELALAQKGPDGFLACDIKADSQDVAVIKNRHKHVELLQSMPFFEIISSKKIVQLHDGCNTTEPPPKQAKLEATDAMETDEDPVMVSIATGDRNLEYVIGVSTNDDVTPPSKHPPVLSTSSDPNSILLPMHTLKSPSTNCKDIAVAQVLWRYITDGAFKADDLLDEISIE